jgi:hypothetical protein
MPDPVPLNGEDVLSLPIEREEGVLNSVEREEGVLNPVEREEEEMSSPPLERETSRCYCCWPWSSEGDEEKVSDEVQQTHNLNN